jgi:hypothetical protein
MGRTSHSHEECWELRRLSDSRNAMGTFSAVVMQLAAREERPIIKNSWSGRRDSNPRPRPWQGRALPLSYTRIREFGGAKAPATGRAMPNAAGECNRAETRQNRLYPAKTGGGAQTGPKRCRLRGNRAAVGDRSAGSAGLKIAFPAPFKAVLEPAQYIEARIT